MKLLTKEIERKLPPLYSQEKNVDPTIQVKFFHCMSPMTWFAWEYSPERREFFGLITGGNTDELGYFSLDELEETRVHGLKMERDMYFDPQPLSKVNPKIYAMLKQAEEERKHQTPEVICLGSSV